MWVWRGFSAASSSPSPLAEGPAAVGIGREPRNDRVGNFFRRFGKKRVRRVRMAVQPSGLHAGGEAQRAQGFHDETAPVAGGAGAALTAGRGPLLDGEAMDRPHVRRAVVEEEWADHARQDDRPVRQDRT